MRRIYIDFMGNRKWLFIASGVVLAIAIGALAVRGLTFGIEFRGGTTITLPQKEGVTTEKVQQALSKMEMGDAIVQPVLTAGKPDGWLIRSGVSDTAKANDAFQSVAKDLGIPLSEARASVIAPSYGSTITNAAMMALVASIAAILLYISIRFEYKMSVTAVIALVHDAVITLGIYALVGREVTPNTVAALLTILGYSLYDTIVVFHRIRENTQHLTKKSFMQMANDSINQVLARWINTGISQIIPVVVLLAFGGETLKDFAFALLVGLISGAYSSVGVASPLYAMWKETEPRYKALKERYARAQAKA
ncbi:MAG TPA: protein translocase subunit SecF [Coriobacteriia bacterium]